ncbi:protein FAM161A isoform X1 [Zootoca vivipara]|uniref:protein FAM161A isoform X1 n=1 Tax=Zootoca vivipara TaxID=8524 RepID=UPI00293BDF2D|nr:protein FAM161A isoform X1 [Zootoca vivipara]
MDAAHRAALLAASCLHTPVDPRTRAPVALYERETGRPAPGGGERQDSLSPKKQQHSTGHADCRDWIDLSKMYLSNQEYYLKLEELKYAHLETMAKLENMYRNKLYLKDVQPLSNLDVTHSMIDRSWEPSPFQPQNMCKSFSEPDLNNSFHSDLSHISDKELELEENDSEDRSLTFGKEQAENSWDGSSLEDYSHCNQSILSKLQTLRKSRRKKKKWSPKITVPEPFQMTIREARIKQQNIKSKSLIELENNLLRKELEEEAECQKKFRANPVPAYVFVPLYHEIMQENEERRKALRERRRKILLASQKPFQFIEREAQKKEMKKMQLKGISSPEKKAKVFKAKPVPKFVYSSEINERLKEEELYRDIRIQMRSEELLRNSSVPNSRLGNRGINKNRQQNHLELTKEVEHRPKTKAKVPDFESLHQKFLKRLQRQKNVKHITACEPFNLCTPNIESNKEKILEDIQMDEEKLKETRWPYASSRAKPQMRSLNANSSPSGCEGSVSPRITESTRRRLQAVRESAEEKRKVEEEKKKNRTKQKERARKLQRLIHTRAEANDPHQSLAQMHKSKFKIFRKHEKQRMKEYLQELEEMEERVQKRPLLLEQATQKNARIAAEKHYSDILRELGLCEEFVSKKGETATKMLLQDHSSGGSDILTADGESDNENKAGDGEFEREWESSQLHSAQSCGEEDGDEEDVEASEDELDMEAQPDHDDQDASEYENNEQAATEKTSDDEG